MALRLGDPVNLRDGAQLGTRQQVTVGDAL